MTKTTSKTAINSNLTSSHLNNLTFVLDKDLAGSNGVSPQIVDEKLNTCRKYVERFATVAIAEQETVWNTGQYNPCPGITRNRCRVALELAVNSNNHFGMKCSPDCVDCNCQQTTNGVSYGKFRVFDSAWASYREHSHLLSGHQYGHLKNLSRKDYKGWARGLKKAGYSEDKAYAKKLIRIIETLDLYQFDA